MDGVWLGVVIKAFIYPFIVRFQKETLPKTKLLEIPRPRVTAVTFPNLKYI